MKALSFSVPKPTRIGKRYYQLDFILPCVEACLARHGIITGPEDLADMRFREFCLAVAEREVQAQQVILQRREGNREVGSIWRKSFQLVPLYARWPEHLYQSSKLAVVIERKPC